MPRRIGTTFIAISIALLTGLLNPVLGRAAPQDHPYTDTQIEAAIDVGWNDDLDRIMHSCIANDGGFWNRQNRAVTAAKGQPLRVWRIHGQPPLSRVAQEADFARRRHSGRPVADDVSDLIADDVFTVWAEPGEDLPTWRPPTPPPSTPVARRVLRRYNTDLQATNIETVLIRPRGDNEGRHVVQPLSVETTDGTVESNLFGASAQMFGVVATFSSDAVREIIAERDLEVLLIESGEEFKCNLDDTRLERGYDLRR